MQDISKTTAYCQGKGLTQLKLTPLSLDEVQEMVKRREITDEIYQHLVKLSKNPKSDLEISRTQLDQQAFNGLVFLELDETRFLTVKGRSVGVVSDYIKHTFLINGLLTVNAFMLSVGKILQSFNYTEFTPLILAAPARPNEMEHGSLYIKDGNHRALALGILTNIKHHEFKNIDAVIVYYNRDTEEDDKQL
jgi:hypothetical protein